MEFEMELEVSLVSEYGLTAGVLVFGRATGLLFGKPTTFGAEIKWQPGGTLGSDFMSLLEDPMALFEETGLGLEVNISGIEWLPVLEFKGYVTATAFDLE